MLLVLRNERLRLGKLGHLMALGLYCVTVGSLHGYATAWTWVGSDSSATACSTPTCTAPGSLDITVVVGEGGSPLTSERVSCSPAFARTALCTAGTVTADPTYESVAALGFNFNQDIASDAGSLNGASIANSITITVQTLGNTGGNSALRLQLTDLNDEFYCVEAGNWTSGIPIPITRFSTECWGDTGTHATSSLVFQRIDIFVPSHASLIRPFAFCLTDVSVE